MNWIDIVILSLCCAFFLLGLKRGIVDQVFSATAILGGIFCALILYDIGGELFVRLDLIKNRSIAYIIGFLAIFIFTYLIIQILGWLTSKMVGTLKLGWLNRLSGGAIGLLIGILISFTFITVVNLFSSKTDPDVKDSILVPYVETAYGTIKDSLPDDLRGEYENARKLIRDKGLKEAIKIGEEPRKN